MACGKPFDPNRITAERSLQHPSPQTAAGSLKELQTVLRSHRAGPEIDRAIRRAEFFLECHDDKTITFPNARVMIYSDGRHNQVGGKSLLNAFCDLEPSPLMTAFIGEESASEEQLLGANQMKELATICPIHNQRGYFLINSIDRQSILRGVFRMASGATGFCPQCLKTSGFIRPKESRS